MGRPPCCDKSNVKKGPWTAEEDAKILAYVSNYGIGNWTLVPKKAGLNRCGKSCRLRWTNYLRPDLKHDGFTLQEEELIIDLHKAIGSRWSLIAKQLPGRTDNDVKNYWNTKLKKKLFKLGIDPVTHKPISQILSDFGNISSGAGNQIGSFNANYPIPGNTFTSESTLTDLSSQYSRMILKPAKTEQTYPDYYNPSWDFLTQCSSSSSSSPSDNVSQINSSPCQQSHVQNIPFSPFDWSNFTPKNLPVSANVPHQEQDMKKTGDFGILGGQGSNISEADSSATSFVEAILNQDSQLQMEFPELLDESSYY